MKPAEFLPPWWYISLMGILAVGILLICVNPPVPYWISALSEQVQLDAWVRFTGIFLVAIVLTHLIVFFTIRIIDGLFGLRGEATVEDLWPATMVGIMESVMYPLAFIAGGANFIGIWILVKVAGQWVRWGTEFPEPSLENMRLRRDQIIEAKKGRRRFNKFLVGNSLRVLLGGATYLIIRASVMVPVDVP